MGILRSASVVSASTLLSRVLGMIRDILFASLLGAGFYFDAFVVAWRLPNLFRRLMGEGALSSAFIPIFSGERERAGLKAAFRFFQNVLTLLSIVLAVLTVVGVLVAHFLPPSLFGTGAAEEKAALVLSLLEILFPYVFLINVMALFMAVLNSVGHFFGPAVAPALLNAFWIGGILLAPEISGEAGEQVKVVAAAIVLGGIVQLLVQVPILRAKGIPLSPRLDTKDPALRRMLVLMVPMVFGMAPVQVNVLLDTLIAEVFIPGHGANSYLFLGNRLMQFPLAMIGIAMGIVVFPVFSRQAKEGRRADLGKTLTRALSITFFLAVPAAAGLIAVAGPLISLIFEHGKYTAANAADTGRVLFMYALGIPAYCGLQIMTRLFYSLEEVKTPVRVGAAMVGVNIALNLALVGPLRESGLALATALSAVLNLALLAFFARRQLGVRGLGGVFRSLFRTGLLAAVMGAAVYGLILLLRPDTEDPSVLRRALWVLPPIAAGAVIHVGGAWLLRFPEVKAIRSARE